jgi:hypothetical protein
MESLWPTNLWIYLFILRVSHKFISESYPPDNSKYELNLFKSTLYTSPLCADFVIAGFFDYSLISHLNNLIYTCLQFYLELQ